MVCVQEDAQCQEAIAKVQEIFAGCLGKMITLELRLKFFN